MAAPPDENGDARGIRRTLRYRWLVFGIVLAAYFFVYYQRNLPSTLDMIIIDDLGSGLATLWSAAYYYVYAALQLPVGLMTDRVGPRKVLSTALVVITIGTFATSFAETYSVLMIGKIVMSCGMACIFVPLTKIIVTWFVKKDFALMNGFVIAVGNLAGIMAAEPTRIILDAIGWRGLFMAIGIITLMLAMLCVLFVRNRPKDIGAPEIYEIYPEEKQKHETYEKVPLKSGIVTTLKGGRAFWMPAGAYFMVFGTMMLFQGRWIVSFFKSVPELLIAGTVMMTFLAVGKLISTAIASTVAKKVGSKRKVMLAANIGYLGMWGVIWLLIGHINMFWFWAGVNFLFGFFGGFMSLVYAQTKEWFPASISGTVISLFNMIIFFGGGVFQTISIWVINEKSPMLSQFTTMWGIAFVCVAIACVLLYLSVENKTGTVKKIVS